MKTARIRIRIFIFIIAAFILIHSFALTQALKISDIEIELLENGAVIVNENITCENLTHVKIIIPPTIETPGVYLDKRINKQIEYNLTLMNDSEQIEFYSSKNITIEYKTDFFTEKKKDTWTLSFSLPATPNLTKIRIIFPKNLKLSFITETPSWLYMSENYQIIELKASEKEIDFACNYKFIKIDDVENTTIGNKIDNKSGNMQNPVGFINFINPLIIILIISILFISTLFLILKRKRKRKKKIKIMDTEKTHRKVKKSILHILDENEKIIVRMLEESNGNITQAYIYKTTKIPKASLSRKITALEQRNIIECKKEGRVNWIKLKDWVFEE